MKGQDHFDRQRCIREAHKWLHHSNGLEVCTSFGLRPQDIDSQLYSAQLFSGFACLLHSCDCLLLALLIFLLCLDLQNYQNYSLGACQCFVSRYHCIS